MLLSSREPPWNSHFGNFGVLVSVLGPSQYLNTTENPNTVAAILNPNYQIGICDCFKIYLLMLRKKVLILVFFRTN